MNGTIYLRIHSPFAAKHIEIRVKGIEKTKWIDIITHHRKGGGSYHTREKRH